MFIGHEIHHISQTDSTMNYCKNLAKSGGVHGTVVSADFQTTGRGRFLRKWVSSNSENLLLSILLKPDINQINYLNMAASLSIYDVVSWATNYSPSIKWPNDVLVEGQKLAGILIESEMIGNKLNYAVLGLGINVNHIPEEHKDISNISTSLMHLTNQTFSRSLILKLLLRRLNFYYSLINQGKSLTKQWSDKLITLGTDIKLTILDNPEDKGISGIALSVNEDGSLNIKKCDGSIFIASSGEVTLYKP